MNQKNIIRQIYFYAASLITLIIMVVSTAQILNTGLKTYVFPKADDAYRNTCDETGKMVGEFEPRMVAPEKEGGEVMEKEMTKEEKAEAKAKCEERLMERRTAERQREFVNNFSMLFVAAPVFWFHFRIAQRERREELGKKA